MSDILVTCDDPRWHVSPDETLQWWLSAVILEWQPRPGDQSPLSRWGHYPGHYRHHHHCHPVISCHWYGTKWWASLWFSKLVHDYLQHNLRQTRTKRSLPDLESNELFRNLSVHGLSSVLCHWNWLPGVLIQQHHPRVGWNIIMNAALQPGAQHLSVTGAYLMKYNSIIHTSLQLDKSPLNTLLSAEASLVVSWSMATI